MANPLARLATPATAIAAGIGLGIAGGVIARNTPGIPMGDAPDIIDGRPVNGTTDQWATSFIAGGALGAVGVGALGFAVPSIFDGGKNLYARAWNGGIGAAIGGIIGLGVGAATYQLIGLAQSND